MVGRNFIPTCYFPSTVMFVDDSRDFLTNFTLQLDDDLTYRLFDSPFHALEKIHDVHQSKQLSESCLSEYLESGDLKGNNYTLSLDLAALHWEVYNPQRFAEISVVVVDYAMPGMNGLEFCRKMENSPIKRILLTGRADEQTVIEAFNDGIIDLYIQKHNPNITQLINESIANMQRAYFQNMSSIVIRMLSAKSPSCLEDPVFHKLFNKIIDENHIVEYYLTDNSGSFLMLDADGNIFYLIVKNEQDLQLYYEVAFDNQTPKQVLDDLRSGRKIPYFWKDEMFFQSEWNDWATYLCPAEKISGQTQDYYYAFVSNPALSDVKTDKILSYHAYLEELDMEF